VKSHFRREIIKTDEPLTIPLAGPLEEIATTLRDLRKSFPMRLFAPIAETSEAR
jgi:hypothetical protein